MTTTQRLLLAALVPGMAAAGQLPEWTQAIRADHPRLFLNDDLLPGIRKRAAGAERATYTRLRAEVERSVREGRRDQPRDRGVMAAKAAFDFLVSGDETSRDHAIDCLETSLDYYDLCYTEKRAVNWYSTSRVHAIMAWDWLYNDVAPDPRQALLGHLVAAVDRVLEARPRIHRENYSGHTTGFYGIHNCCWFLGLAGHGTGGDHAAKLNEWLVWGREENLKLLRHRRSACGDDGGSASPTLGYAFGAYPWAEQNFLYTWLSATGENLAPEWPHSAWLSNYVIWNWIPGPDAPLEFGYGDTPHTSNRLSTHHLYSHMSNIRHLFGRHDPASASLARAVQERLPERVRRHDGTWFIYPYLLSGAGADGPALDLARLPTARHFEEMGQVFMRSGTAAEDTYALFTCGGSLAQHRHFDALNLVILHRGAHLALDSGTRHRQFDNGQHLANYFAQTVAHNCLLIHQPGEPPARYWGGDVTGNHGGQHNQLGSNLVAFRSDERFVYAAGDASECYRHGGAKGADGQPLPEKVKSVTRQVLYLLPDCFVVFDTVTATDPNYRKDWLLHTAEKPLVRGRTARAAFRGAALHCQTLLPASARIRTVGGPDKEFLAAGTNWQLDTRGLNDEALALIGRWRLEVSPDRPSATDHFLHVIRVGPDTMPDPAPALLEREDLAAGTSITAGGLRWRVMFRTEGEPGGQLTIHGPGPGRRPTVVALRPEVQPQAGILPDGDAP